METTTYNCELTACQPENKYLAEGKVYIKNLKDKKSGDSYSYHFFFDSVVTDADGKRRKMACQIAPLRSKMIFDLKREYGIDVNPEDFSAILYQTLWGDGSWAALDSFQGRCSFFAWLKRVARNAVTERLVDERLISDVRSRTAGNTRLVLRSQSPSKCQLVIDGLMVGSKYHSLLTAIYVDRLPEQTIMNQLHISNTVEFLSQKQAGENKLKDALLRSTEFAKENILRDKQKAVVTVSSEFVADIAEWYHTQAGNTFADVFGTNLTDGEVSQKVVQFLYDFSGKMDWSDQDRYIWRRRFVVNADPDDLASEEGHSRGWLDTRYSRLNHKFRIAIRLWWKSHAA